MPQNPILTLGLTDLSRHISKGELSSVEVTSAFLERLAHIQPKLRPMTRIFARESRVMAEAADDRRRRGARVSPLDGVPVTLKESISTEGTEVTLGLPRRKGQIASKDAVVAHLLREAGVVFLGKTNLSQAMLFHESRNPLFGTTTNPWDTSRTPGGSSGGEACAIAAYGSPGGFGTDIGGSIRVPAHFTGTVGLKPTVDRISNLGLGAAIPGQEIIRGQIGPMARRVCDLEILLDVVSPRRCAIYDPRVPALPIGDPNSIEPRALRVGYFIDDHVIRASRACRRAVELSVRVLEDAGCTVVAFEPPHAEEILFTYLGALSSDGARTLAASLDEHDVDPALTLLLRLVRLPRHARKAAALSLALVGERVAGQMLEVIGEKSVAEVWALTRRARELQAEVFTTWRHLRIDAVLCPPHATPALPHGASRDFTIGGALSMRYNLLDFPAGVVPVTRVRNDETSPLERPRQRHERRAATVDEGSAGLPVGVQVVALPRREDVVLRIMRLIEESALLDDERPVLAVDAH
jgi:fatty acid amide hydrolase